MGSGIDELAETPLNDPMNRLQRSELISEIGRELQSRMTTQEINVYLGGFGISGTKEVANSKWVYVRELLATIDDGTVIRIAFELDLAIPSGVGRGALELKDLLTAEDLKKCRLDFERALDQVGPDPASAVGHASTTLETICKTMLDQLGKPYPSDESIASLYKAVAKNMKLSPEGYADGDIKRVLGGLANAAMGLGVLRTRYSTFHGKGKKQYRLAARHARFAVNSLAAVGTFLVETFQERALE